MTSTPERRRAPRIPVRADALIATDAGAQAIDCAIHDMNCFGARISVGDVDVPASFYLVDVLSSVAYMARPIWREGDLAGLRFSKILPLSDREAPGWLCDLAEARLAAGCSVRIPRDLV
jgi:hypothetical protein